jgi:hypothetical protein
LGGRGRQISEFEASLEPGLQNEFQDSQGYTEKPCLEKPKKKKKKERKEGRKRFDMHTLSSGCSRADLGAGAVAQLVTWGSLK